MKQKEKTKERRCPLCNKIITGHPNKKFCNSKHRYRYHNIHNPRGTALRPARIGRWEDGSEDDFERIGEKIDPIEDNMHPQDPYSLGQE